MIVILILAASSLLMVTNAPFGLAQSGTSENGIIGSDTTWTQANSPYTLTGPVAVNQGVTLTIEAGTTLNLDSYYMEVNGSLIIQQGVTINMALMSEAIQVNGFLSAIGTSDNPIHINGISQSHTTFFSYTVISLLQSATNWNPQSNSGSIIENTVFNDTVVDIQGAKFSDNTLINGNLELLGGSPIVSNNNIATLNIVDGSPFISDNNIKVIDLTGGTSAVIADNVISEIFFTNIEEDSSLLFERNLITNGDEGISFLSIPNLSQIVIENNTITNNQVGISIASPYAATIIDNNIYDNSLNVKLSDRASNNVDLSNNWWGTTDQQAINQSIYDFKNDFNLGTVNFVPFLNSQNPEAKPNPNAPILTFTASPLPTPQAPEFPTLPIIPVFILMLAATIILRPRKQARAKDICAKSNKELRKNNRFCF